MLSCPNLLKLWVLLCGKPLHCGQMLIDTKQSDYVIKEISANIALTWFKLLTASQSVVPWISYDILFDIWHPLFNRPQFSTVFRKKKTSLNWSPYFPQGWAFLSGCCFAFLKHTNDICIHESRTGEATNWPGKIKNSTRYRGEANFHWVTRKNPLGLLQRGVVVVWILPSEGWKDYLIRSLLMSLYPVRLFFWFHPSFCCCCCLCCFLTGCFSLGD